MRIPTFLTMRIALGFLAVVALHTGPADSTNRVWIEGGSNIADWSCKAVAFQATVDSAISRVSVRVSVRDLKCGNRKMDHDLYSALKATDPANPSYIIASFEAVPATDRQAHG